MKHIRSILAALMFLSALSAVAQSRGNQPFDLMKSLAGNWEGKNNMDESVQVSYRLTGGGSALMSEIQTQMRGRGEGMISMIHMDGGRLLLTHYCAAGNQPRMQASASPDGKSITFDFIDATKSRRLSARPHAACDFHLRGREPSHRRVALRGPGQGDRTEIRSAEKELASVLSVC